MLRDDKPALITDVKQAMMAAIMAAIGGLMSFFMVYGAVKFFGG